MIRKFGGQRVPKGPYWDRLNWRIFVVQEDGGMLPGGPEYLYLRLTLLEALLASVGMGGVFVLFLPFVGITMVAGAIVVGVVAFLAQKVLCVAIRHICRAETWVCELTHRYFCKDCGRNCDDDIAMLVKAFLFSLFFLAGVLANALLT
jgi:hypothetical protein